MRTLRIHDFLKDKVLVSRESARQLEDEFRSAIQLATTDETAGCSAPPIVDFSGVEGMAPSFLDELLSVFESVIGTDTPNGEPSLIVANVPTRLSLKFEAIARGHGMSVKELPDGSWFLAGTLGS